MSLKKTTKLSVKNNFLRLTQNQQQKSIYMQTNIISQFQIINAQFLTNFPIIITIFSGNSSLF
jgi:hypothetical protein